MSLVDASWSGRSSSYPVLDRCNFIVEVYADLDLKVTYRYTCAVASDRSRSTSARVLPQLEHVANGDLERCRLIVKGAEHPMTYLHTRKVCIWFIDDIANITSAVVTSPQICFVYTRDNC